MIYQAIVLVGGRGTRLKSIVQDVPKPMADVCGKPFLHYLLTKLSKEGIKKLVLAVGYKHEFIQDHFGDEFQGMEILYSVEEEPLGTGGAIKKAFNLTDGPAFVLNGDAFFNIPFQTLEEQHFKNETCITIALKRDIHFDRYGNVELDETRRIIQFQEKGFRKEGSFNGGIYIIDPNLWPQLSVKEKFSFETDVMEAYVNELPFFAVPFDDYFIDIGIPEAYEQAQHDFSFFEVDSSWSVFLDRDGVINKLLPGDYVKSMDEFEFIEGSKEAVTQLSKNFKHVFVVTNQQGIGKGIMTHSQINDVHDYMLTEIEKAGGSITEIYYCPDVESENPPCRKPNTGMALQAKKDFPDVDFSKSVMIGDSETDMEFGKSLGMKTLFISSEIALKIASFKDLQNALAVLMFQKTK